MNLSPNSVNLMVFAGRILLAAIFVVAGFQKLAGFEGIAGYIASKGLPMPKLLAALTIALELVGGMMLVVGYKVRMVALLFFLWLIPVTFIFHSFWDVPAAEVQNQMNHFLKNLAIMGGMLMVMAFGPGRHSEDRR